VKVTGVEDRGSCGQARRIGRSEACGPNWKKAISSPSRGDAISIFAGSNDGLKATSRPAPAAD